jgi:nitrile hydratase
MTDTSQHRFSIGERVRVRRAYPPGHLRTPYFIRGKSGVVIDIAGRFANPEELAYGRDGLPRRALYRVRFRQIDIWPEYHGAAHDSTVVDIYEHWLEAEQKPS